MSDSTKLSASITVAQYRRLETLGNREALSQFIVERFGERYFRPIEDSKSKHGFTLMAVACLVIETLESFYQGLSSTRNESARMFRNFFNRDKELVVFNGNNDWFYYKIRCGILHQGESRDGWRIVRRGQLLDTSKKSINATQFVRELKRAVEQYAGLIKTDDAIFDNFRKKMDSICKNCQ